VKAVFLTLALIATGAFAQSPDWLLRMQPTNNCG